MFPCIIVFYFDILLPFLIGMYKENYNYNGENEKNVTNFAFVFIV